MSRDTLTVDDCELLKLLEMGLGEAMAAKQLEASATDVNRIVKGFLTRGILRCVGDQEVVDWKAYGNWKRNGKNGSGKE